MDYLQKVLESPLGDILGQEGAKQGLKSAFVAKRNVIIVGPPGIGKTTLARNVASLMPELETNDCGFNCLPGKPACPSCRAGKQSKKVRITGERRFVRVQGSPELTAEDLIGDIDPVRALKYGALSPEAFTPGKIFKANNGILFFDEVNRCGDKLQNALLQVLEERKVTIGSYDIDFVADFIFIGTMNPGDASTEKLSDVFLDRFDLIEMGYPENQETERAIVEAKVRLQEKVGFPEKLKVACITFIRQLREDKNLERKPSVRATIGLIERAQATAIVRGAKKVSLDDVRSVVISVLGHRISLKPSVKYLEEADEYVEQRFEEYTTDHSLGGDG